MIKSSHHSSVTIPDRGVEKRDVQRSVMARWKKIVRVMLLLAVLLMYATENRVRMGNEIIQLIY